MATARSSTDVGGRDPLHESLNETEGWYLRTIYRLSNRDGARVRTGALADELGVSPGSVTEMVAKLSTAELVRYEKYAGVETATRGATIAESLAWRQCVVAVFFDRELGHEIDPRTAYRIGFNLPLEAIGRLERLVDTPSEDACRRIRPVPGRRFVTPCAE